MNRMIQLIAILASSVALMGAKAAPQKAAEPKVTFSVPAACSDVYAKVYTEIDASWDVTVLVASPADEAMPTPEALASFLTSVPGLEGAVAKLDAVDRDAFYVRVKTRALGDLKKRYPAIDAKLLEAAKVEACREAAAR